MNRPQLNISEAFQTGIIRMKNPRAQRAANCLQWRQQFLGCDNYALELYDKRVLNIQQIDNGEMKGIGTGAVVWPAAHVLAKYMEIRYGENTLHEKRVIDIGSGTGCTGLVAGILGASVTLTDQDSVRSLLQSNIDLCAREFGINSSALQYKEYEWEETAEHLEPPFDIILVSDCVLPKLYPIEPLIKAVAAVMDDHSVALFSYEHRVYPTFDPRFEFRRLAALYGLEVHTIPLEEHHSYYCSDDIEIWEVRRSGGGAVRHEGNCATSRGHLTMQSWGDNLPEVRVDFSLAYQKKAPGHTLTSINAQRGTEGEFVIKQDVCNGRIGATLWASSVVLSRFLMTHPTLASISALLPNRHIHSSGSETQHRPLVVDIGAGCGLTSVSARLCGYDVVAADKAFVLDTLSANMQAIADAFPQQVLGSAEVREFDWSSAFTLSSARLRAVILGEDCRRCPDIIVLSDCFYQGDAVQPVLRVLNEIASPDTIVVIANEMRSALDEFIRTARHNVSSNDIDQDASVSLSGNFNFKWDFKEVSMSNEQSTIYSGPSGHLVQRPTRLFLSVQESKEDKVLK